MDIRKLKTVSIDSKFEKIEFIAIKAETEKAHVYLHILYVFFNHIGCIGYYYPYLFVALLKCIIN